MKITMFVAALCALGIMAHSIEVTAKETRSAHLEACMISSMNSIDFHGVALVGDRNGKYGAIARKEYEEGEVSQFDTNTRFDTGSVTKMFTSVLILQLSEQGKLRLDDAIGDYLPDIPNEFQSLKIRSLLSHSSGMGDVLLSEGSLFGDPYLKALETYEDLEDLRDFVFLHQPQDSGTFRYSNAGYILLGMLIEKLADQRYENHLDREIFDKLSMFSTSLNADNNVAVPYTRWGTGVFPLDLIWSPLERSPLPFTKGIPAGSSYSTLLDMYRFARALAGDELIGEDAQAEMFKPAIHYRRNGADRAYGLGATLSSDGRTIGHGGSGPGFNSALRINLDTGDVIVTFANLDRPMASRAANRLMSDLAEAKSCFKGAN